MTEDPVRDLLARLATPAAGGAWTEFLQRYTPAIRGVVRRHEPDASRAGDCFDHVCAALSDDGFRRLRSFRSEGPARFTTWLRAVVSNLCVDWHRAELGRRRPPRTVLRLPDLDQHVYHCIYERGMSRQDCVEALVTQFPGLTLEVVAAVNSRLFRVLSPTQRWQLASRRDAVESLDTHGRSPGDGDGLVASEPGPDVAAEDDQERRRLQAALSRLAPDDRLLLRLRYEQDLTLSEVARLTAQPDPFHAHRRIQAALGHLAELMSEPAAAPPPPRKS